MKPNRWSIRIIIEIIITMGLFHFVLAQTPTSYTLVVPAPVGWSPDPRIRNWYLLMFDALDDSYHSKYSEAKDKFDLAAKQATSDDLLADTEFYRIEALEGMRHRADVLAAYKKFIIDHPNSGRLTFVCYRLGTLYSSVTLTSKDTSQDELVVVSKEMTTSNAIPWFEMAIAKGPAMDRWVLSSRSCLYGLYDRIGRKEDARKLINELVALNIYDVKAPAYRGPYSDLNDPQRTASERIDSVRVVVNHLKEFAERDIVIYSIINNDTSQSLNNMDALIAKYPGSKISELATQKKSEIRDLESRKQKSIMAQRGLPVLIPTPIPQH